MFAEDKSIFFNTNEFAVDAMYLFKDGQSAANINIIFDRESQESDMGRRSISDVATCEILQEDIPSPVYGDKVMLNGNTWNVLEVASGDGFVWELKLEKDRRRMAVK